MLLQDTHAIMIMFWGSIRIFCIRSLKCSCEVCVTQETEFFFFRLPIRGKGLSRIHIKICYKKLKNKQCLGPYMHPKIVCKMYSIAITQLYFNITWRLNQRSSIQVLLICKLRKRKLKLKKELTRLWQGIFQVISNRSLISNRGKRRCCCQSICSHLQCVEKFLPNGSLLIL